MADRKAVKDRTKLIVRLKPGRVSRAAYVKPSTTSMKAGPGKAYRAKIEALLAELPCEQLVDVWQQVCPFLIASEFGLPDRLGIIQDLADFVEILQPNLEDMTADQLCRWVERYAGAANQEKNKPFLRPKALRVKMPTPSSRRTSRPAAARTPR